MTSDYQSAANKARDLLDTVSPSMCLAKWKQVSLHLPTGLNNSCYHPPLHRIPLAEIEADPSALHNTSHKKARRQEMLDGVKCAECSYCWNIEATGNPSDRHYRSGEPWAYTAFDEVMAAGATGNVNPSYVEVNFNHACNLKCSYCSPQFSSSWASEIDALSAYPTLIPHNNPDHFTGERRPVPAREHNPYVEAFWQWWPDLYPHLQHFRMTGGEPLMDKNTYRVFDYILANPKPDLHLNVTSNFSVEPRLFEKYMSYAKQLCNEQTLEHFMQFVSVDTWGKQAEYIRDGLDFELMKENVETFLQDIPGRNSITFIVTFNNLSIANIDKLLDYVLYLRDKYSTTYQRVWIDFPILHSPAWQSIALLPESYSWHLEQTINKFKQYVNSPISSNPFAEIKDFEITKLERDLAWMRKTRSEMPASVLNSRRADFYRFFNEYNKRRGLDFLSTFPEMTEWWELCRHLSTEN